MSVGPLRQALSNISDGLSPASESVKTNLGSLFSTTPNSKNLLSEASHYNFSSPTNSSRPSFADNLRLVSSESSTQELSEAVVKTNKETHIKLGELVTGTAQQSAKETFSAMFKEGKSADDFVKEIKSRIGDFNQDRVTQQKEQLKLLKKDFNDAFRALDRGYSTTPLMESERGRNSPKHSEVLEKLQKAYPELQNVTD